MKIDERIYEIGTYAAGSFSLAEVLDKLAEAAVKITLVKACSIRLLDEASGDLKMRSTYGLSDEYRNKGVVSKEDEVIKKAFDGEAMVLDDMRVDKRVKYREAATREGLVSQLTVAMKFRDKPIGVLRIYSPEPKRFNENDISLARAVASQCAIAITNARLYSEAIEGSRIAEQVRLAGIIQRRMIPEAAPVIEGLDIGATYVPCFEVGGDLYDFFKIGENHLAIGIADVIGKGLPAAIMMSSFRGVVKAYFDCAYNEEEFSPLVKKFNSFACDECRDGEFITFFNSVIDYKNWRLNYCNCGHEPTILIRDGGVIDLDKGGLVLGVDRGADYETGCLKLKKGDCLIYYTDGLIDAQNYDGDIWTRERMLEAAMKFIDCPADQMINNILAYRRRFVGLAKQIDDTSIIIVKVNAEI